MDLVSLNYYHAFDEKIKPAEAGYCVFVDYRVGLVTLIGTALVAAFQLRLIASF